MSSQPTAPRHQRDTLAGTILGAWRLESLLGEGAAAFVYRARHVAGGSSLDNELAAVKVLHPEAAANPKVREAFMGEARILTKLRHASIVRVHEWGVQDGRAFIAMQLIEGRTLEELLQQSSRLGEPVAVDIAVPVARALDAMYRQEIVHRDIKPGNIMIEQGSRRPILFDFGAAIDLRRDSPAVGEVYGTPAFCSPEQARGDGVIDGRADIYSLGVTLYRMVAGRKPFYGSRMELLSAQIGQEPPPPSEFGWISPELERIVLKAMSKRPQDRFATGEEMADALDRSRAMLSEPPPTLGRRLRGWLRGGQEPE